MKPVSKGLTRTLRDWAPTGTDALLERTTLGGLAASAAGTLSGTNSAELRHRWPEAQFCCCIAVFASPFTSTPEVAVALSNARLDYSLGCRRLCQVNWIHSKISVNCRWLFYVISMA